MKKILKYITFLAAALLVTASCDYDDTNYDMLATDPDPNATFYVQFKNASKTLRTDVNDAGLVNIETTIVVGLMGTPQPQDIVVNLSVNPSTTIDASAYELSSTSITIPAGKTAGSVNLTAFAEIMAQNVWVSLVLNMDAGGNTSDVGTELKYDMFRICAMDPSTIVGDWVVNMQDNYGDGWQGSKVIVTIDGVSQDVSIPDYWSTGIYYGPDVNVPVTIAVPSGSQTLTFSWVSGDWPSEASFNIVAPSGNVAGSGGPSPAEGEIIIDACVL